MSDKVIQVDNLAKIFKQGKIKVNVFQAINFVLAPSEYVAIMGQSGAGKSTLLHLLGGLEKPTSGDIKIMDKSLLRLSEKKKSHLRNQYMGFVYQFHHLLPEFNALENVCIPRLIRGEDHKNIIEKASYYIEKVGLKDRMQHRIGELSGGERQRIALARALVTEPKCVLADEPTGNLDAKTAESVADLMQKLNEELGIAFVVVTHNKDLAKRASRILNLENGRLQPINSL